jgi:hypothetical protein
MLKMEESQEHLEALYLQFSHENKWRQVLELHSNSIQAHSFHSFVGPATSNLSYQPLGVPDSSCHIPVWGYIICRHTYDSGSLCNQRSLHQPQWSATTVSFAPGLMLWYGHSPINYPKVFTGSGRLRMRRSSINFSYVARLSTNRHGKRHTEDNQLNLISCISHRDCHNCHCFLFLEYRQLHCCSNQGSGQYRWSWLQPYVWGAWVN